MFNFFKRGASKATKRTRSANVRAAKKFLHTLMTPMQNLPRGSAQL